MPRYCDLPDFPGYRVGDDGSVWSCWERRTPTFRKPCRVMTNRWHRLKRRNGGGRYIGVRLKSATGIQSRRVHRLVLEAFIGPCPAGMECRHLDGDPANNRLDNLEWGTRQTNMADTILHGTATRGERNGYAKLTAKQVAQIKRRLADGEARRALAEEFKVATNTIGNIAAGTRWRHVEKEATVPT